MKQNTSTYQILKFKRWKTDTNINRKLLFLWNNINPRYQRYRKDINFVVLEIIILFFFILGYNVTLVIYNKNMNISVLTKQFIESIVNKLLSNSITQIFFDKF